MKTSELEGAALDFAVGIAQGWGTYPTDSIEQGDTFHCDSAQAPFGRVIKVRYFHPSTNWAHGGPIIERENIDVMYDPNGSAGWGARMYPTPLKPIWTYGSTPLIAAMRCFVASKLGNEINLPEEFL